MHICRKPSRICFNMWSDEQHYHRQQTSTKVGVWRQLWEHARNSWCDLKWVLLLWDHWLCSVCGWEFILKVNYENEMFCAEYYPNCEVMFMGMANIHSIRRSFQCLRALCAQVPDPAKWVYCLRISVQSKQQAVAYIVRTSHCLNTSSYML